MKWLKKIFGKDEGKRKADAPSSIALSNLDEWLEERARQPEFEETVRDLYRQVDEVAAELDRNLKTLRSATPAQGPPPRLVKAGLASREKVGTQLEALRTKLTLPQELGVDSAKDYHAGIMKQLENTMIKFGRAQKYMAHLFPEESRKVNASLGSIAQIISELNDAVEMQEQDMSAFRKARKYLSKLEAERAQIGPIQAEISNDEDALFRHRAAAKDIETEMETLASGTEGQQRVELKESLKDARQELLNIEAEMTSLVSPLSKALARMVKQDESERLSLQHREIFEKLTTSPADALDEDISGALLEIKSKLGLLGLRPKMKDKVEDHLDLLVEERPLETLKSSHSQLEKEIQGLGQSLVETGRGINLLEERFAREKGKMEGIEARLSDNKKKLAVLKDQAQICGEELNAAVEEIAGKSLDIDMGS